MNLPGEIGVEELATKVIENDLQEGVSIFLAEWGWLFLTGLAILFFKTTIESVLAGLAIFLGNDYNNDDIILLDGRPGRIVRVSPWKSTFYLYNIKTKDGKKYVSGGTKLVIENNKLKDLKIEKPLGNFDLEMFND